MLQFDPSQIQTRRVYVDVSGVTCPGKGSQGVLEAMVRAIEKAGIQEKVQVVGRGCFGLCKLAPNMYVEPDGTWYSKFTVKDVSVIVRQHLIGNKPVTRLVHYPEPLAPRKKAQPKRKGKRK